MSTSKFIQIPGFSKYEISMTGDVRNIKSGIILRRKTDSPDTVQILGDDNTYRRVRYKEIAVSLFPQLNAMTKAGKAGAKAGEAVQKLVKAISEAANKKEFHEDESVFIGFRVYHLKQNTTYSFSKIGDMLGLTKDSAQKHFKRIDRNPAKKTEFLALVKNF